MGMKKEGNKYQLDYKLKTAKEFEASGKLLHAVQVYKSIIENYPEETAAYFNLADLYEHFDKVDSAIVLLKEFLNHDPENKEVRLFLGQYMMRNEKWREANDVLSYVLVEDEPIVSFFLGYSNFKLKKYKLSRTHFLDFISIEEHSELVQEAYLFLSKIEVALCDFKNALTFAKKAEVLYDNSWELNSIVAVSHFNLGMYAHAISSVEKAIRINQREKSLRELAGKIYLKSGEFLKAEENFLKYIELNDTASSELYSNLGEACFKGSKPKEALIYYEVALKIDPENQTALTGKKEAASALENN
jgi:tetratricopeptide (TPR) repeat protein